MHGIDYIECFLFLSQLSFVVVGLTQLQLVTNEGGSRLVSRVWDHFPFLPLVPMSMTLEAVLNICAQLFVIERVFVSEAVRIS